jgi:hypothetical protein
MPGPDLSSVKLDKLRGLNSISEDKPSLRGGLHSKLLPSSSSE